MLHDSLFIFMIYSDILGSIKTVDQARSLSSEIDVLLDSLFKTEKGFEIGLNSISAYHSQMLKESLAGNGVASQGVASQGEALQAQSMIKEYLEGLKDEIQRLKTIKLTLAFEPKQPTIDNLFAWTTQNLGSGFILEIAVDKTILGGATVEFEGKYEDLSLKKKVEEVFGRKREELMTYSQ